MASRISKRRNCSTEAKDVCPIEEVDRISTLPDAILCHILSFVPTRDAVRICSLSKRWSRVWISVPSIEIDDNSIVDSVRRNSTEVNSHFMDFVDRVFHLNDVPRLRKLCLTCNESYDLMRATEWIAHVITRNVEELDLTFLKALQRSPVTQELAEFPLSVFTKLETLKVSDWGNIRLQAPTSIYLPSLKRVNLNVNILREAGSLQNLLDGCPVLEELDIMIFPKDTMLCIRSSSLKSLRVETRHYGHTNQLQKVVVDAKLLEQVDFMNDVKVLYDIRSLPSLVKVSLDHCKTCSKLMGKDVGGISRLDECLRKLSKTKYLFLSSEIMKCLEYLKLDDLSMFSNLLHLELKTFDYSWLVLPYLLERSPNLRMLVLHKEKEPSRERHLQFQTRECLMLNLEEIKFSGFKGSANEMELVKYFLNTAKVLKKFSIQSFFSGSKKQAEILKKLLMLPRGSTECQIMFN